MRFLRLLGIIPSAQEQVLHLLVAHPLRLQHLGLAQILQLQALPMVALLTVSLRDPWLSPTPTVLDVSRTLI